MVRLIFIPLVLVPVFYGHKTASADTTGTAQTINCLNEMNEERAAAGLPAFEGATDGAQVLPKHDGAGRTITAATLWNQICQIITKEAEESEEAKKLKGTFAYYRGENNCKAAVQYWKDGFSLFKNELPPTYTAPGNPEVYSDKAVSFVALYNPQASPVASCAFVTCATAAEPTAPDMLEMHGRRPTRRLQGEEDIPSSTTTTAVICLTNPVALSKGQQPFKEEVWQKIVQAIVGTEESNGVSPVRPSLAVGFIMMLFAHGLF
ncbi:SAG family member [Eimeria necatrix]|uniref:SAG family member n=1 Tax=Eimeria necatrix TaxID=51315 RepID=U6N8W7_9EIME|nr:SAG family member [Eimeria necatrix]CDJ70316.1 SAG family member [Eimeria necatrix]